MSTRVAPSTPSTPAIPTLPAEQLLKSYTIAEIAELQGISQRSVRRLISTGQLRPIPGTSGPGRALRVAAGELYRYIYLR